MQSLIAEEMANEGYFALALNQFVALCRGVEVDISYKSKALNEDLRHKIVLEFVKSQINNIGGYEAIFKKGNNTSAPLGCRNRFARISNCRQ